MKDRVISKIIKFSEVAESPTFCLSPLRYLGECHRCERFKKGLAKKCKPVIRDDIKKLLEEKKKLLKRLREINKLLYGD